MATLFLVPSRATVSGSCPVQQPYFLSILDFLGFHKLSNLVYQPLLDLTLASMTLTTCLAFCSSTVDDTHVAIILETRCICAKGLSKNIVKNLKFNKGLKCIKICQTDLKKKLKHLWSVASNFGKRMKTAFAFLQSTKNITCCVWSSVKNWVTAVNNFHLKGLWLGQTW